jgi:predicted DNA-binding protein
MLKTKTSNKTNLFAKIDKDLKHKLKMQSIVEGITEAKMIEKIIEHYIEECYSSKK